MDQDGMDQELISLSDLGVEVLIVDLGIEDMGIIVK